jgi:hypothetical protein
MPATACSNSSTWASAGIWWQRVQDRVRSMAFKRNPAPVAGIEGRPDPDDPARSGALRPGPEYKDGGFH